MATSSIEDHDLPKAIMQRIIKSVLPEGAAVQRDAKTALSKACTVFINYLSATAHDAATDENRKIISANDVLAAMQTIELGDMVPQLEAELEAYKQLKQKRKVNGIASASNDTTTTTTNDTVIEDDSSTAIDMSNNRKRKSSISKKSDSKSVKLDTEMTTGNTLVNGSNGIRRHTSDDEQMADAEDDGDDEEEEDEIDEDDEEEEIDEDEEGEGGNDKDNSKMSRMDQLSSEIIVTREHSDTNTEESGNDSNDA